MLITCVIRYIRADKQTLNEWPFCSLLYSGHGLFGKHSLVIPYSYRTVFSTRSTTTLHFVRSTKETYVLMAVVFAIDGILHLMAQNVQNQRLLKELFTYHTKSTYIVPVIFKATATKFLKVTYVWPSG